MSLRLTLITLLYLLLLGRSAQAEVDEPGLQGPAPAPTASQPLPQPQVEDPEVVDLTAPPQVAVPRPLPVPALSQPAPRPDRGPHWTLDVGAGYGGFAALFGEEIHGPVLSAALSMTFGGGRVKHGLRLGGCLGLMGGKHSGLFDETSPADSRLLGVNLGYLLRAGGFWFSAGWGVLRTNTTIKSSASFPDMAGTKDKATLLENVISLGYDLHLTDLLALRLAGEAGTFFVTWRGQATASLVLRF